jgi:hypothetical protein
VATGRDASQNKYSEQNVLNSSFDKDYDILAVENTTFNPVTSTIERVTGIQGNGSLALAYTGDKISTITETIGTNQYQTTITWTGDLITGVSEVVKL